MYDIHRQGSTVIIRLREVINSYYDEFSDQMEDILSSVESGELILDFSALHYVNSFTIRNLLKFIKILQKKGFRYASCSMCESVYEIFRMSALLESFNYCINPGDVREMLNRGM